MNIYFSAPKYVVDNAEEGDHVPYHTFCVANSIKEAVKIFADDYRWFFDSFYVVEQDMEPATGTAVLMETLSGLEGEEIGYQVKLYGNEKADVIKIGMRHAASRQGKGK